VPRAQADPVLSACLKRLREERGLSQETVAHRAGMSVGAISRLERGKAAASWATVTALLNALGVTLSELGAAVEAEG
jgi:transcriptional regulator with XRE-family HTH domain